MNSNQLATLTNMVDIHLIPAEYKRFGTKVERLAIGDLMSPEKSRNLLNPSRFSYAQTGSIGYLDFKPSTSVVVPNNSYKRGNGSKRFTSTKALSILRVGIEPAEDNRNSLYLFRLYRRIEKIAREREINAIHDDIVTSSEMIEILKKLGYHTYTYNELEYGIKYLN